MRDSHIFASAVREVLESKLLRDVTTLPVSFSQYRILKSMTFNGQRHVGEVAGLLGVSAPAASKNVDKLVRLGLLVRRRSKGDRRAALITLSRRSRGLVSRYERHKAARLATLLREFRPAEIRRFSEMLERVTISLIKQEHAEREFCFRCVAYFQDHCPVGQALGGCPLPGRAPGAIARGKRTRAVHEARRT